MQSMSMLKPFKNLRGFSGFLVAFLIMSLLFTACEPSSGSLPTSTEIALEPPATQTAPPTVPIPTETPLITEETPDPFEPTPDDLTGGLRVCLPDREHLSLYLESSMLATMNREPNPSMSEPCTTVKAGDAHQIGEMVLALVAPFPTVIDEIKTADLQAFWQKGESEHFDSLMMFPYALNSLTWLWGEPIGDVEIFDSTPYFMTAYEYETYAHVFMKEAWTRERTWAIVAFEELHPRWKVIALDGQSPIHKSFKPETYPLTIPLSAYDEDSEQLERAIRYFGNWKLAEPFSNYHPDKLATVILTGVTAMARATAVGMDERGILVPGEDLADVLKEADILHISNEVPFAENCPKQSRGGYLVFCSPASYMELLRSIGTDVVELTGDHFQDYGSAGMLYTLDLYAKEGWPVYGGGKDIFDARAPIKLEVNGNKIAFLGCNAKSPNFAQASETSTGAYHCDMDYMAQTVKDLVEEGYLPIVTFQHEERYAWQPNAQMTRDFDIVLNAGAVIASGSQAHQPHFAEFLYDGFAHYGLGNLFFDQYGVGEYTHWAFIDRHVFYDGRHISTELLTIRFLDRVKATWASPEERVEMLEMLFDTGRMMWPGTKPWEQQ